MTALDFEFAMRFTVWASTVATAIIAGHWVYHFNKVRMPVLGVLGKALGWTVHQSYWFQSWLAYSSGNLALHAWFQQYKWIVWAAEVLIVASTMLLLSPYLEARLGKYWGVYAASIVAFLMALGVAIGYPTES